MPYHVQPQCPRKRCNLIVAIPVTQSLQQPWLTLYKRITEPLEDLERSVAHANDARVHLSVDRQNHGCRINDVQTGQAQYVDFERLRTYRIEQPLNNFEFIDVVTLQANYVLSRAHRLRPRN